AEANRVAQAIPILSGMSLPPEMDGIAYTTPISISRTDADADFLTLNTKDPNNPTLKIDANIPQPVITKQLTGRLHISEAVVGQWLSKGEIPLEDFMKETKLDQNFDLPVFQAAAEIFLTKIPSEKETLDDFTGTTERFLMMAEDLQHTDEIA